MFGFHFVSLFIGFWVTCSWPLRVFLLQLSLRSFCAYLLYLACPISFLSSCRILCFVCVCCYFDLFLSVLSSLIVVCGLMGLVDKTFVALWVVICEIVAVSDYGILLFRLYSSLKVSSVDSRRFLCRWLWDSWSKGVVEWSFYTKTPVLLSVNLITLYVACLAAPTIHDGWVDFLHAYMYESWPVFKKALVLFKTQVLTIITCL